MSMHPDFPDWYRSAHLSPDAALLEKRWSAVETLSEEPSVELLQGMLSLFAVPGSPESAVPDSFRAAFKDTDLTFAARNNVQELRVLAGAVLRNILETASDERNVTEADLVALGLTAATFSERTAMLTEPDHLRFAQEYVITRGRSLRSADLTIPGPRTFPRERFDARLKQVLAANGPVSSLADPLFGVMSDLASTLAAATDAATTSLKHVVDAQGEELNVLWWLQSEFSRTLALHFSQLSAMSAAIILPTEVAALITFQPGPPFADSVILRALQLAAGSDSTRPTVSLSDAINSTARTWRESVSTREESARPALCPIMHAISSSLLTDTPDDWQPVFRKSSDVSLHTNYAPSDIALQVYREHLFLQAVRSRD